MKRKISLISLNIIAILCFSLSILFDLGYLIMIASLILLWASSIYTAIKFHDKTKSKKLISTHGFSFLIFWMLFALAIFLFSIFIWDRNGILLVFSIIFLGFIIGAILGEYTKRRKYKIKNNDVIL